MDLSEGRDGDGEAEAGVVAPEVLDVGGSRRVAADNDTGRVARGCAESAFGQRERVQ